MSEIIDKITKDLAQKRAKIAEYNKLKKMLEDELIDKKQAKILEQEIEKIASEINQFSNKKLVKKDKKVEDFFAKFDIDFDTIESQKVEFLIDDFLIKNEVTMLVARPAVGKSLIAISVCNMLLDANKIVQVFYLDNDNSKVTIKSRNIHLIKQKFEDKFRYFVALQTSDFIKIIEKLKQIDLSDTIIIFDSITNFIEGDRNNHSDVSNVLRGIKNLRNNNATVIFLHHQNKLNKDFNSNFAGSSAFTEDISCAFLLTKNEDKDALILNVIKDRNHMLQNIAFRYCDNNTLQKLDLVDAYETYEDIEMREAVVDFIKSCMQNKPTYSDIMRYMAENGYANKDKVNKIIQIYKNKIWICKKIREKNNRDVFELIDSSDK